MKMDEQKVINNMEVLDQIKEKHEDILLQNKQIAWREKDIKKAGEDPLYPNLIEELKMQVETKKALIWIMQQNINRLLNQVKTY